MIRKAGAAFLIACVCLSGAPAMGAPAEAQRDELATLRGKIRTLQDEIARSEETHDEASDELAASDKSISLAQRRLRDIGLERRRAEEDVDRIAARRAEIEAALVEYRKALGDTIFRLYVEGGQAGARRFLSGKDPNQLARDAYYLEQIAKERIAAIEAAREATNELKTLAATAEAKRQDLVRLENDRRHEQEKLLGERKKRQQVLSEISSQLRDQKREMATLQRNEGRLEKLIRGLERIAKSNASSQKPKTAVPTPPKNSAPSAPPEKEVVTGRVANVATEESPSGEFGELKGRLRWPVRGELVGRFGGHRAGGGATWRGIFIKSSPGSDVKAVANGTVAFADWLRGFGNLLILDHGDGYMTVYGNNESVFKNAGETVKQGDTIASVGDSGGLDESGLYFEIRFRGQPQDPAKWVAGR